MSSIERADLRNHLLSTLPDASLDRVLPEMRRVDLRLRAVLHPPGSTVTAAYFPDRGYVSLLTNLEDGSGAEVGMVGREGLVGVGLAMGVDRTPVEALVQAEGTALAMEAGAFRSAMEGDAAFRGVMLRYAMAFLTQVTMTAACNGRHLVQQRLSRWLLMAHDRASADEFVMTHEFLSTMLGVRRASVTVAARVLQGKGLIRYEQGRIRVLDRAGLEGSACECHGVAGREYARLLGVIAAK